MKALILNSGMGSRMGVLTSEHPKCMTELTPGETIISRQLRQLCAVGITDVVITTGLFDHVLVDYCESLGLPIKYTFVNNPEYAKTNYIYSIALAKSVLDDDIVLMHGDLVFSMQVLNAILQMEGSCMAVSATAKLPEKDFKAVINGEKIQKVGVEFFDNAVAAQPLYKLTQVDWKIWLERIGKFCDSGITGCYAENALNEVADQMNLRTFDVRDDLCNEIDTPEDLAVISRRVAALAAKTVYLCFSTDVIHSGHIALIAKAAELGKVIVGVLSDDAVASYKRFPILSAAERAEILRGIKGVCRVVVQKDLSYTENLRRYRPDYVVHGDDWREGFQKPVRDEVVSILKEYGGKLVEFPYVCKAEFEALEKASREQLSIPDIRRGRLRRLLEMKPVVTAMATHNGLTGLIVEKTAVYQEGKAYSFDAMWVSSLCDSTAKGKPDIELVDMTSRFRTIDELMEVTTKPIIFDGDTGGLIEHFVYTVRTLERMGVSAIIIEDKTGLKKNSLFGTEVEQTQDSIEHFCEKITAGKRAQKTREFMIIARIESLILEQGMEDALEGAFAFTAAGADGIMIHSRRKDPAEIFEFIEKFREKNLSTPIVVVPTSFNMVTEEEFAARGANIVIYANQLIRSAFPAMKKTAEMILSTHRAKEADDFCMSIKEILTLIPEE